MSRATTGWPSSAKQAAVTRPTQPTPITPIGSLSPVIASPLLRFGFCFGMITFAERAIPIIWSLVSVLQQVVRDPVGVVAAVPGDQLTRSPST